MIYCTQNVKQIKGYIHLFFLISGVFSGNCLQAMESKVLPVPTWDVQQPNFSFEQSTKLARSRALIEEWVEIILDSDINYIKGNLEVRKSDDGEILFTMPCVPENVSSLPSNNESARHRLEGIGARFLGSANLRRKVSDTEIEKANFRYNCQLRVRVAEEKYNGSGVVLGSHHVITAAHVVTEGTDVAQAVKCRFGVDGEKNLTGPCRATRIYIPKKYLEINKRLQNEQLNSEERKKCYEEEPNYDIALIVLDRPIGLAFGRCGMACVKSDALLEKIPFTVSGYPGDPGNCKELHYGPATDVIAEPRRIFHNAEVSKGQSGGPVLIMHDNRPYVIGISTHQSSVGICDIEKLTDKYAAGVRFSETIFRTLVALMEKTWRIDPGHDSHPYRTKPDTKSIFAKTFNLLRAVTEPFFSLDELSFDDAFKKGIDLIDGLDITSKESTKREFCTLFFYLHSGRSHISINEFHHALRLAVARKVLGTWNEINPLSEKIGTILECELPSRVIYLRSKSEDSASKSGLLAFLNAASVNSILRDKQRISSDDIASNTECWYKKLNELEKHIPSIETALAKVGRNQNLTASDIQQLALTPLFGTTDVYALQCNNRGEFEFHTDTVESRDLALSQEQRAQFDALDTKGKIRMRFMTKYIQQNKRGALSFICQLKGSERWFLAVVVKLENKPPFLVVLNSENSEIGGNYLDFGSAAYFLSEISYYYIDGKP